MHLYTKTYNFADDQWIKLKRLAAINGTSSVAKYLDKIVETHINNNYQAKYDILFNKEDQ
jgi:hypothetical protein